ncbi:hypothetical protein A2936_02175 [Candidatus Uhrbacteria bacterium RIFCSPLOWO2_01_FULL_47_25]|uniref:Uncharacterized protein n=2 Tax=Patescibacteria group TaxID=1783273 RepID=A0A1F7UUC8_9BACT|nr:MAG: hypothetical protein A2693_03940 [Candidatus Curtissbacteria bacterium RIFCSPHIGHO2_01_FULL_40_12]OGL81308.1 MAG: hypothetical protein A2936_02175 [Candidatus Uhrbacteria bacterium RIFCSPLOWO2_01_FULL_47_25]
MDKLGSILENNENRPPEKIPPHPWERAGGFTIRLKGKDSDHFEDKEDKKNAKSKRYLKTILKTAGILVGFPGIVWLLDKIRGDKRTTDGTTVLNQDPYTEQANNFDSNTLMLYSREGMESSQLDIAGINSPDHLDEAPYSLYGTPVYNITAKFGPSWLFAYKIDEKGEAVESVISEAALNDLVNQLGLQNNPQGQEILRANWIEAHKNPDAALQLINGTLIPGHAANPQVINYYQCSVGVYNKDIDKSTWEDRQDAIKACAVQAKNTSAPSATPTQTGQREQHDNFSRAEHRNYFDEDFNEAVGVVCEATGLDLPLIRGAMETLVACGGGQQEAMEIVSEYVYVPDVKTSTAADLQVNTTAFILLPFYLLRIGHYAVNDLKGSISSWLDKREYRQMFNELAKKGRDFFVNARGNQ